VLCIQGENAGQEIKDEECTRQNEAQGRVEREPARFQSKKKVPAPDGSCLGASTQRSKTCAHTATQISNTYANLAATHKE